MSEVSIRVDRNSHSMDPASSESSFLPHSSVFPLHTGYMEADLTVTKLSRSEFIVVATDTMHNHVLDHMRRRLTMDDHVTITDVTARYSQINLQGPKSRDLLQELTSVDLTEFPFRGADDIDIGLARALCMRITYVGELGYELFIPTEQARHVYDEIIRIGSNYGLRHAGLRALGSLRLVSVFRLYYVARNNRV